jgi:hypothetical protein
MFHYFTDLQLRVKHDRSLYYMHNWQIYVLDLAGSDL